MIRLFVHEQQKKRKRTISRPYILLHLLIVIKLLNIIKTMQRPKFIFQQQDQRQEESMPEDPNLMRHVTQVRFDHKNEVDEQGNLGKLKDGSGNQSNRGHYTYSKRTNPEISLSVHKSQSQIDDPSLKAKRNESLKYKQPESHVAMKMTNAGKNPSEVAHQNNPHQYEGKLASHLQEAKGMKPNILREDNQSPIPQDDQRYTLAPPVYAPTQFDPYKYVGLGKKKSNNKNYQIILEPDAKKKKKPIKTLGNTTHASSIHNSSQVPINEAEIKQAAQPSAEIIQDQQVDLPHQYPSIGSIIPYNFQIQKVFGRNFLNPEYKIFSPDGELIVTGKKQSFHLNSHYNIFSGDIKEDKIIGTVLGSFGGTQFNIYNAEPFELLATVCYVTEVACNTFRKLEIYVKNPESNLRMNDEKTKQKSLKELYQGGMKDDISRIVTKEPTWRQDLQIYVMNLKGKGKMSSTKNMVLKKEGQQESPLLFCKSANKKYYLEIGRPFNLLIAMGLLVSSFDFKLLCQ